MSGAWRQCFFGKLIKIAAAAAADDDNDTSISEPCPTVDSMQDKQLVD